MTDPKPFYFSPFASFSACAEPRVFTVSREDEFPAGFNLEGARLVEVRYDGGGLGRLLATIEEAASIRGGGFQALLEDLEAVAKTDPLVVYVEGADHLLADIGPALLHFTTGWETFAHHANGVSPMYLVLETGPRETVNAAFYPGGVVKWRSEHTTL